MDARRLLGWGLVALCTACSGAKQAVRASSDEAVGGSGPVAERSQGSQLPPESRRYVDQTLGFELTQPGGDWLLDETDEQTPEGLAIPVVLRHRTSGAQVVLQVAPAVASPIQFAERLTLGLRSQPGFVTSDPEPLPLSDSAVGFQFAVGDNVRGRVVVRDGSEGHVFMMLATWPSAAPDDVPETVNTLFESVHPLPVEVPEQL
ncbi:hypothetical protein D187_003264 [Cystobacter fuscus DSM 2262]|uniref:Lipoprotein n=1 Tax=Cystobacter fuscus (strain ATCC 25194 / DSM 2262 / NBRC 100088 / M29) TaxID=1242864 RepID=S9R6A9_CYSF2|nr:hypothetical protein [Cystobacter fuscus]EPX64528.1 hypothetical protein D187_003264 [Cystobacter fuscus DSM 2262]